MCTHVYIYIYMYTLFSVIILFFVWNKNILGEMKKKFEVIQKHGPMLQTWVKSRWAHMRGEVCEIEKKEESKNEDGILALLCLHLCFWKHDAKGDISWAKQCYFSYSES